MKPRLTLLSRAYCGLCDTMASEAGTLARAYGASIDVIDIDAHPSLVAVWDTFVPVLFLGAPEAANELCHYHLDAERLRAALARLERGATAPAP